MTNTTTDICSCVEANLRSCAQPLAHANHPCCMAEFGPHDLPFGPADYNVIAPRQKSVHEDAAVKRALAAERMSAQRGNGLTGTPPSGRVSRMTNTTAHRSFDKPSTEAQRNFIRNLISQRDAEAPDVQAVRNRLNSLKAENGFISSSQASKAIDDLKGIPADVRAAQAAATQAPAKRTNKFAQACGNCKVTVEAGEGVLESVNGRWMVWHKEGECPTGEVEGIPAGHYAIEAEGVVKFYSLESSGKLFVQASDEYHLIKAKASRESVLEAIKANVEEASRRYGREIGRCGICNRTLTDEVSRANGIGPVCANRAGWV